MAKTKVDRRDQRAWERYRTSERVKVCRAVGSSGPISAMEVTGFIEGFKAGKRAGKREALKGPRR